METLLYRRIMHTIEQLIVKKTWKTGDKLPSIRSISAKYKVSISTVLKAYYELESKSFIEARPKSGYYVCYLPERAGGLPSTSQPLLSSPGLPIDNIIDKVFRNVSNPKIIMLSLGVPSQELLPVAKLNKCMVKAMRSLPANGTLYEQVKGDLVLREHIARRSFHWNGHLTAEDLVTTSGCINAIAYCLMATTKPGDKIAIESPVYFGLIQLTQSLGLKLVELPTSPSTGIEIGALQKVIRKNKIRACLLVTNFSNPMGSCMPDEHKKQLVELLYQHDIPLIEDDIYGDIYFGEKRPSTCKSYDEHGMVLWCGSVSKTLAPGYRVGWIAPGRYMEKIEKLKLCSAMASPGITERAIAVFLENGRYDHHLTTLRRTLQHNMIQYIKAIHEYFPPDTRISVPQGGLVIWLELDKRIDTMELYETAMHHHISISPGRSFTLQDQYHHCLRLSYGLQWNDTISNALKLLGKIIKSMMK